MMKNYIFCIILFVLIPIISCDARPVVLFEETTFDFGKVHKESTLKHTFNFKNAGTATLIIDRIKAG